MNTMMRFENQVALITGPSDQGIGGAIAERLASEGAALSLLGAVRPNRLIKRLERKKVRYTWSECDITSPSNVKEAVDDFISEYHKFDVVVNNAGVDISKPFEDLTEEEWHKLIDINLSGAMRVIQAALPHVTEEGGAIINIASALGMAGCAGYHAYSASKAGLIGFTQSLAMELAPKGIRALCVAPALVHTPMVHQHIQHLTQEAIQQIESCHPLGVGSVHDVAAAVAFLASNEAKWITGVSLPMGWVNTFGLPVEGFMKAAALKKLEDEKSAVDQS